MRFRADSGLVLGLDSAYWAYGINILARSIVAKVTVSVPEDLKKKMEHVPDVNWSEVARRAFEQTIERRMRKATEAIDRLRKAASVSGWSGAREVRKWRDAGRKP